MAVDDKVYRRVFADILKGYSEIRFQRNLVYIKHQRIIDQVDVDIVYNENYDIARKSGALTEEESLVKIKKEGLWTSKDEQEMEACRRTIKAVDDNIKKAFVPSVLRNLKKQKEDETLRLAAKQAQKNLLLGLTCENFAAKRSNDFYIFISLFKDKHLSESFYTKENFNDMYDSELSELVKIYNAAIEPCVGSGLQKVAASSFFQNIFRLTEDIYHFYGRPIVDLTFFQTDLALYGRYFKNLFEEMGNTLPQNIRDDPDKMVDWVHVRRNLDSQLEKIGDQAGAVGLAGMTYEDLKELNLEKQVDNRSEQLKKSGQKVMEGIQNF